MNLELWILLFLLLIACSGDLVCLLLLLLLTACGPAFTTSDASDPTATASDPTDAVATTETRPETMPVAEASEASAPSHASTDASFSETSTLLLSDADASAPLVDAPAHDPRCPDAERCLCESASGSCPESLPYACGGGELCCNWRAPDC